MSVVPYSAKPDSLDLLNQWGGPEAIAGTEFVPKHLRGNTPAIMAAILYGHEVGLGPMQSLAKIAVIDGRPTLSAEAMRGLILAAGHELWIEEQTNTRVTVGGRRHDGTHSSKVTWTLDDAKRARIAGRTNWQAYPRQMLLARASAELARAIFADVIGGLAITEEVDADGAVDVDFEDEARKIEESKPSRRRRRIATAPTPEAKPDDEPQDDAGAAGVPARPKPPAPTSGGASVAEEAPPEPMSAPQRGQLFALFTELGIEDRDAMLALVSTVVGREVTSRADLSKLDASRVIEHLVAMQRDRENEHAVENELRELGAEEVKPAEDDFPEGF